MKHDIRTRSARVASWLHEHGWSFIAWTFFVALFTVVVGVSLERCQRREECERRGGVLVKGDWKVFGVCVEPRSLR